MSDRPSLWQRLFRAKSVSFAGESSALSVIAGYPSWPIFDSYGQMYRRQPAVRTVVDFFATNIAQLNPKIYERVDDTDRREWNDHPLAVRLRNPNPTTTRYAHLRDTVADLKIYDRAYWRKVRTRGLVTALVRLPPSRLLIEFNQQTFKTTYRFDGEVLSREELVIFHGYHPDGNEEGVSPLETLRRVLSEEWAATTFREWYWRNAARAGGVIERPPAAISGQWSDTARQRFREQWDATTQGGVNSGRTALLEDGMHYNTDAFSPKDSEYIEGRKLTYVEVARVYGPALVSLVSDSGGVTATEANHRHIYQDALAPTLRMLQDEIDGQLLSLDEFNQGSPTYCEFNLADKLKGSFEEQGRALVTSVGVPYMSVNEGRARLNLSRIDDEVLDVPVQPLNVLYGGQPSVVVPTSDPGLSNPSRPAMVPGSGMASPRELAEIIQKIYLGVGVVLTAEEAREILNRAGATLSGDLPALSAGLRSFTDRQERTVRSHLGALKDQGALTVLAVWQEDRWNRELSKVYQQIMPKDRADHAASLVNAAVRQAVAEAFADGGLDAVTEVFADAKSRADDVAGVWVRQPALSA